MKTYLGILSLFIFGLALAHEKDLTIKRLNKDIFECEKTSQGTKCNVIPLEIQYGWDCSKVRFINITPDPKTSMHQEIKKERASSGLKKNLSNDLSLRTQPNQTYKINLVHELDYENYQNVENPLIFKTGEDSGVYTNYFRVVLKDPPNVCQDITKHPISIFVWFKKSSTD